MSCPRAQTHWVISSHCCLFCCCSSSRSCSTLARFVIRELSSVRDGAVSMVGGTGAAPAPVSPTPTCTETGFVHSQLFQLSHRILQGH